MLSDWTDEPPVQLYLNLKKMGSYYNYGQPTTLEVLADLSRLGFVEVLAGNVRATDSGRMILNKVIEALSPE